METENLSIANSYCGNHMQQFHIQAPIPFEKVLSVLIFLLGYSVASMSAHS